MRFRVLSSALALLMCAGVARADEAEVVLQQEIASATAAVDQIAQMRSAQAEFSQEAAFYRSRVLQILPDYTSVLNLPGGKLVIRYSSRTPEIESKCWEVGIIRQEADRLAAYAEGPANITNPSRTNMSILPAPALNRRITSVNRVLGWRVGNEEAIAFLTVPDYVAYRRALGNQQQNALMWGRGWVEAASDKNGFYGNRDRDVDSKGNFRPDPFEPRSFATGDTLGRQLLAVTCFKGYNKNNPRGVAVDTVQTQLGMTMRGSTHPPELGRLHGHALVNALADGGTPVPLWLQWGIAVISAQEMERANGFPEGTWFYLENTSAEAGAIVRQNGRLGPKKWNELIAGLAEESYPHFRVQRIEAQAQRMTRFFLTRFGTGAVVETLQRLGSGQSVDEALFATTQLSEEQFFAAWQDVE